MLKESGTVIYETQNYEMFKLKTGNRPILKDRLKKKIQAIKELDKTKLNPIIVNPEFEIIDGQHRYLACKSLNLPVYFVMDDEDQNTLETITLLNSNQSNWFMNDFVNSYASQGIPSFKLLKEVSERNGITPNIAANIVDKQGALRDPCLRFTIKDAEKIDYICGLVEGLPKHLCRKWRVLKAIIILSQDPEFAMDVFKSQSKKYGDMVISRTLDTALRTLKEVYNYRQHKKLQ